MGYTKLTNRQFKQFCELTYRESGIKLTEEKRELLNARLAKRLRVLNIDAGDYLSLIHSDVEEMKNFLDAISTNHTFFFRESHSFKYLKTGVRDIWCAASSSGEEPYSLAAYCLEEGFTPSILATDISQTCLENGKRAIFDDRCLANIPKHMIRRYFQKGKGKWESHVRVKESVRKLVQFERFNLLKDHLPQGPFDIIFCRNVMIYFDAPTKEFVVNNLCKTLKPNGHFIIGGAESLSGQKHSLKYIEPSVYRK
jgi:chemotaxis protein methyltransferase CheR